MRVSVQLQEEHHLRPVFLAVLKFHYWVVCGPTLWVPALSTQGLWRSD